MARIILVALFVLAVAAQRAPLQSCAPANPFLRHMVRLGMQTYPTPKFGVQMCGNEFALHGTCCDETKIKEYVLKDQTAIQKATELIVHEYEQFMNMQSHILHLVETVLSLKQNILKKKSSWHNNQIGRKLQALVADSPQVPQPQKPTHVSRKQYWSAGSQINTRRKKICKRKTTKRSDPLRIVKPLRSKIQLLQSMNQELGFVAGTRECWSYITNLRASSVCSTCSGRSHIFFRKDKALMSEDTCVAVLDKCYKPLRQLTLFVSVLNLIPKLVGIESKAPINSPQGQKELLEMENLSHHLKRKVLESTAKTFQKAHFAGLTARIDHLRSLQHSVGFNSAPLLKAERQLCKKFIVLNHLPIIRQVSGLFAEEQHSNNKTRDLLDRMKHSIRDSKRFLKNPQNNPNWRMLRMKVRKSSIQSDVAILTANNIDSAYSSVGVSGNRAMDFSNTP